MGKAWAANYDGSTVVGWSEMCQGNWAAFRWTKSGGMENLNLTYSELLTPGSVLREAMAISPDSRFIAGRGYNAATERDEAYLFSMGPHGTSEMAARARSATPFTGVKSILPRCITARFSVKAEKSGAVEGV